jgi:putative transposase
VQPSPASTCRSPQSILGFRRAALHQSGPRWARATLQSVGQKETGWFTDTLQRVAKELIEEAGANGCSVIASEDMTGIRDRTAPSWGPVWAFNRLCEHVEYEAGEHDIDVHQLNPETTSRRCSTSGSTHPDTRDGEEFECRKCESENHPDYNAAKDIGLRYCRRNQTGGDSGASLGVRVNRHGDCERSL